MTLHTHGRSHAGTRADAELPVVPAVEVSQLTKTYPGGVEAVKAIDFAVAPGEVFGLLGPNGGKSTTIGSSRRRSRPRAAAPRWPATTSRRSRSRHGA